MTSRKPLIYLACPLSSEKPDTMQVRHVTSNMVANRLREQGHHVYNPLSASLFSYDIPDDYWYEIGLNVLSRCDFLLVVQMPGWSESKGVQLEIALAEELGIPKFMTDWELTGVDAELRAIEAAERPHIGSQA